MYSNGYHVHIEDGRIYGAAADRPIDARQAVHARMVADGNDAPVSRIESLGRVAWDHGTVILY